MALGTFVPLAYAGPATMTRIIMATGIAMTWVRVKRPSRPVKPVCMGKRL